MVKPDSADTIRPIDRILPWVPVVVAACAIVASGYGAFVILSYAHITRELYGFVQWNPLNCGWLNAAVWIACPGLVIGIAAVVRARRRTTPRRPRLPAFVGLGLCVLALVPPAVLLPCHRDLTLLEAAAQSIRGAAFWTRDAAVRSGVPWQMDILVSGDIGTVEMLVSAPCAAPGGVSREEFVFPRHVHIQTVRDAQSPSEPVPRGAPGGFPLVFDPSGFLDVPADIELLLTNTASGETSCIAIRAVDCEVVTSERRARPGNTGPDPQLAMAYNNRAVAMSEKGELDRAIADYTKAAELDPDGPAGRQAREALQRLGK